MEQAQTLGAWWRQLRLAPWLICMLVAHGHRMHHIKNEPERKRSLWRCCECLTEEYQPCYLHGDTTMTWYPDPDAP